jgi:hypothetical protein
MEGGRAEAVDEHDGLPGALLDVVYPATLPRPEVVPVRLERQHLESLRRAAGGGRCHRAADGERDPGLGHQLPPLHHQEPAPCPRIGEQREATELAETK